MAKKKTLYNWCIGNKRYDLIQEWDNKQNHINIKQVETKSHKRYWWKCKKGHTFKATIEDRIKNHLECPYCQSNPTLPEMIIYHYLSKHYPCMLDYRPDWLGKNREIDIFCGTANITWNGTKYHGFGIEYDGSRFHQEKNKDLEKNKICKENGIHIIRIREKGCPALLGEECYILPKSHTNEDIIYTVKKILFRLGVKNPRICIKELRQIQEKYNTYIQTKNTA